MFIVFFTNAINQLISGLSIKINNKSADLMILQTFSRSSISGLYLTKLDRYLTAEEAFDEGFITNNLFLELIERAVSSGIYITRSGGILNCCFLTRSLIGFHQIALWLVELGLFSWVCKIFGFSKNSRIS